MSTRQDSVSDSVTRGVAAAMSGVGNDDVQVFTRAVEDAIRGTNEQFASVAATWRAASTEQLAGRLAEVAHSGSFNQNAALAGSSHRTTVPESNAAASADIETTWGARVQSKYCADAGASLDAQAATGADGSAKYAGQERLVPTDQYADARAEGFRRGYEDGDPRHAETAERLTDRLRSPDGVESDPRTRDEMLRAAERARAGAVDRIEPDAGRIVAAHLREIGSAAATAALVSVAASAGVEVVRGLARLGSDPEYRAAQLGSDLARWGRERARAVAVDASAKAAVAGTLQALVRHHAAPEVLRNLSPTAVAGIAVVAVESAKAMSAWARGELTGEQAARESVKAAVRTSAALAGKIAGQALVPVPVLGAVLGSMVGAYLVDGVIDAVENPVAAKMLELIDQQYGAHATTLRSLFEVNADYVAVLARLDGVSVSATRMADDRTTTRLHVERALVDSQSVAVAGSEIQAALERRLALLKGEEPR